MKKPSAQIESLITTLNKFEDEHLSQKIQSHMQEVYGHLEDVQMTLEDARL